MSHSTRTIKIAPSIIAADVTRLAEQVHAAEAAGADWLHVDVMDGQFVPNMTIGPFVVQALREVSRLPLDVHLMIADPDRYVEDFVQAGAATLTVHAEACLHLHRTLARIKDAGVQAGVALNPATPPAVLEEVLPDLDLVLVMSVNPGFSGQRFIPASMGKVERVRRMLNLLGSRAELEVDGGVHAGNAGDLVRAGASVLVAASAIFNREDSIAANVARLRAAAG